MIFMFVIFMWLNSVVYAFGFSSSSSCTSSIQRYYTYLINYLIICCIILFDMCIHLYVYVYIHLYIHVYTYIYTYTSIHTHLYIHTHVYIHIRWITTHDILWCNDIRMSTRKGARSMTMMPIGVPKVAYKMPGARGGQSIDAHQPFHIHTYYIIYMYDKYIYIYLFICWLFILYIPYIHILICCIHMSYTYAVYIHMFTLVMIIRWMGWYL